MEKVSKGIYISPDTWKDGLITKHFARLLLMQRFIIIGRPEMNHLGEFVPVNEKLSEIFLQLHISEKSGRGVPTIIDTYGKDAITFIENSIVVTIPFNRLNEVGKKVGKKVGNSDVDRPILNSRRQTILLEIKQNPYVTKHELSEIIGISTTAIDNNIAYLRNNGFIERVGKTKGGYWEVGENL